MHLNFYDIDQDATTEAIQGASTNAQNSGGGTAKGRGRELQLITELPSIIILLNLHIQCTIIQLDTNAVRCSEDVIT